MRKVLIGPDGKEFKLAPLTFNEFHMLDLWTGANDMAYKAWKYLNDFHELDDFNEEFLETAIIVLRSGSDEILFNPDGETVVKYSTLLAVEAQRKTFKFGTSRSQWPTCDMYLKVWKPTQTIILGDKALTKKEYKDESTNGHS